MDELVERIRRCSYLDPNGGEVCNDCPNREDFYECKQKLALQAADAIEELQKRVPPVPHGRLIDADAIRADIDEKRPGRSYEDAWALTIMDAAPTILEAEEV